VKELEKYNAAKKALAAVHRVDEVTAKSLRPGLADAAQPPLRRAVNHSSTRVGLSATGRDTL
jgi:hypothetical protein